MHRWIILVGLFVSAGVLAQLGEPLFVRTSDVVYHKERGYGLTMDVVRPADPNGAAVLMLMSGGWMSSHDWLEPVGADVLPTHFDQAAGELLSRGYSLFYVVHGAQPKFTIREIHEQVGAAVRYVRANSGQYGVGPERLGIMGGSAGGHLSLMRGTRGGEGSASLEAARVSDRVQAVVAYFPPTDFVNYGSEGVFFDKVVREVIPGKNPFLQALDYLEYDEVEVRLNKVTDEARLAAHYRNVSPRYHVTPDDAPALMLHGDMDKLVPLQQSRLMVEEFRKAQVKHKLVVKAGGDHGWQATDEEVALIADWFDGAL
tara:strand:- start:716 stop:1660 length:945 start_codon:yes stop_codon:yes gene_type:complete